MKSSLHQAAMAASICVIKNQKHSKNKKQSRLNTVIVAASFLLALPTQTRAQVYQVQRDGSLRYIPRLANPYPQGPTAQRPIVSGQIINGERVIGVSPSAPQAVPQVVPQPQTPANVGANVGNAESAPSPQPAATKPEQSNVTNPQTMVRPDKIPTTIFPIAQQVAAPEVAPAITPAITETQQSTESSVAEEKNLPPAETTELLAPPLEPSEAATLKIETNSSVKADEATSDDLSLNDDLSLPTAPSPAPLPVDEDVMAEIKEIRQQLGGGISATLKGVAEMPNFGPIEITPDTLSPNSTTGSGLSPEELFSQQLRSVISEEDNDSLSASDQSTTSPEMTVPNPASYAEATPNRVAELRACARELEQLAGRLEAIDAYQAADNLRREATELWTKARQR